MKALIAAVRRSVPLVVAAALAVTGGACSDDDGTDVTLGGGVRVRLTDAPSDYVAEARVWISHVYLQRDDDLDDDGIDDEAGDDQVDDEAEREGRYDLFFDPADPLVYDLMLLRDGVEADLAESDVVPDGAWEQLRLVVDSAVVVLAEGYTFEDGGSEAVLKIPSGSSSGIKVQLGEPLEPAEGETVEILVDFDVNRNFRLTGPPPGNNDGRIRGMLFTPVLQEVGRQEITGS